MKDVTLWFCESCGTVFALNYDGHVCDVTGLKTKLSELSLSERIDGLYLEKKNAEQEKEA